MSSPMLSLLNQPSYYRQPPTSYLVSVLIHGAVIALIYAAIVFTPRIDTHVPVRFDTRQLDLHIPDSELARFRSGADKFPGPPSAPKRALERLGTKLLTGLRQNSFLTPQSGRRH